MPSLALLPLAVLLAGTTAEPEPLRTLFAEPFAASPPELRAAAEALRDKDLPDVDSLLVEGRYVFDEQGRVRILYRYVYWLNTPRGVEMFGTTEATYRPSHSRRPRFKSRVISDDGVQHLDEGTLVSTPVPSDSPLLYEDRQRIHGPIPGLKPGVLVEETILFEDEAPPLEGMRHHRLYVSSQPRPRYVQAVIEHPRSLPVRYRVRGLELRAEKKIEEETVALRLFGRAGDHEPRPSYAPAWWAEGDYVAISTARSWAEVARAYSDVVDGVIGTPSIAVALRPASKARTRDEVARELVEAQHQGIRYASRAFGDGTVVPQAPRQTLERGYGDCKDKAALVVAELRARGYQAHVALLSASFGEDVLPKMPGVGLFNHAIVYLPADPEQGLAERWIDPTDDRVPFGELPLIDQGRLALVASPHTEELRRTPLSAATDNVYEEELDIDLSRESWGSVREVTRARGFFAHNMRDGRIGLSRRELDKTTTRWAVENYALKNDLEEEPPPSAGAAEGKGDRGPKPKRARDAERAKSDDVPWASLVAVDVKGLADRAPLEVVTTIPKAATAYTSHHDAEVRVGVGFLFNTLPRFLRGAPAGEGKGEEAAEPAKDRTVPYVINEPHSLATRYRVRVPRGYEPAVPLEDVRVEVAGIAYQRAFRQVGRDLFHGEERLTVTMTSLSPDKVEEVRARLVPLVEEGDRRLKFRPRGALLLEQGKAEEAVAAFRAILAESPDDTLALRGLARVLNDLGYVDEGRRLAAAATEKAPKVANTWLFLAALSVRGRQDKSYAEGWDPETTRRAYGRAVELKPEAFKVRMELARALAFDAPNRLTHDAARLRSALAAVEPIDAEKLSKPEQDELAGLKATLLLELERYDEVEEVLRGGTQTDTIVALRLVAAARRGGLEGARALLRKERPTPAGRLDAIGAGILELTEGGAFELTAQLLRDDAASAKDPTVTTQLIGYLERAAALQVPGWDDGPREMLVRATLEAASEEGRREIRARLDVPPEEVEEALRTFGLDEASRLPPSALRLGLAITDVTVDGDEASGWLLTTRVPDSKPTRSYLLVTRRGGRYRFAPLKTPAPIGRLALEHLKRGDEAAARRVIAYSFRLPSAYNDDVRRWSESTDLDGLALLASVMVLRGSGPGRLPLIRPTFERTTAGAPSDNATRRTLERILVDGYALALIFGDPTDRERATDALIKAEPWFLDKARFDRRRARLAIRGGRFQEAIDILSTPSGGESSTDTLLTIAEAHTELGQWKEAASLYREVSQREGGRGSTNNQLAWLALFSPETVPLDEALRRSREAVAERGNKDVSTLHTLACLQVELGHELEALRIAQQIDALSTDRQRTLTAIIRARVAQRWKLDEVARREYRLAAEYEEEKEAAMSVAQLVERWSRDLEGPRRAGRARRTPKGRSR